MFNVICICSYFSKIATITVILIILTSDSLDALTGTSVSLPPQMNSVLPKPLNILHDLIPPFAPQPDMESFLPPPFHTACPSTNLAALSLKYPTLLTINMTAFWCKSASPTWS